MGKVIFVGYRFVDYLSKAGKQVRGYSLYFNEIRDEVCGYASYDSWVSVDVFDKHFKELPLESEVSLSYNRYGNIVGVNKI